MQTFILDVHGDFACFSRPETSVERFSYPCPTPSAARGIMDAIYVKPGQFRWQIERIEILKPVQYIPLRRNEVKETVNTAAVVRWMEDKAPIEPILADATEVEHGTSAQVRGRTQRQTMALRDVRYRIHARICPWPAGRNEQKGLESQFLRRVTAGKCFTQPYFGQREFVAYFRLAEECSDRPPAIPYDQDVGWMLYDVFDLSRPTTNREPPSISLFRAHIQEGSLDIPAYDDSQVRKAVSGGQLELEVT